MLDNTRKTWQKYFLDFLISQKSFKLVDNISTRRKMEGQPEYLEGQVDQI